MLPEISIIVPAYNVVKYIHECLESIRKQSYTRWECVIVNDGSIDETEKIIKKYEEIDQRFKCINIPHSGSADIARYLGAQYSKSSRILGLDADDSLSEDCLEKMMERMTRTKSKVVIQRMICFDYNMHEEFYTIPIRSFNMNRVISGREAFELTIGGWQIGGNGALFSKDLFLQISPNKYMNSDEYSFRARLLNASNVSFCDSNYNMRLHPESTTHSISTKLFDRLYTDQQLESLIENYYPKDSSVLKTMNKERLINLIKHQILFVRIRNKFNKEEKKIIESIIRNNFISLNFNNLRMVLPRHWNISFLSSYWLFIISSYLYGIIRPTKFNYSNLNLKS